MAPSDRRQAQMNRLRAECDRRAAEKALQGIVDAANAHPEPIHYAVLDAINKGREALRS